MLEEVSVMVRRRIRPVRPSEHWELEPIGAEGGRIVQIELVSGRITTGAAQAHRDSPKACGIVLLLDRPRWDSSAGCSSAWSRWPPLQPPTPKNGSASRSWIPPVDRPLRGALDQQQMTRPDTLDNRRNGALGRELEISRNASSVV